MPYPLIYSLIVIKKMKPKNITENFQYNKSNLAKTDITNKQKVDINILLNRVRLDNQKKKIKNFFYFSTVLILILLVGVFASI